jgi:hypothetical protein
MSSLATPTSEALTRTLEWYWTHGRLRTGDHVLPRGSWLDQLYKASAIVGRDGASRPTLAVWGPSQAGKSTLLASYLDEGKGRPSPCLTWDASQPVNFIGRGVKGAIVLNPHNSGADASGCVTRFTMGSSGVIPSHPVSIQLNRPIHIIHSLACGYLSECKTATADGEETYWDRDKIEREFLRKTGNVARGAGREGFELLREIVDVLEILVKSGEPRYKNLGPHWTQLRRDLLESADLSQSEESVLHFASNILWDGSSTLSSLLHRLRTRLVALGWEGREVRCTMEVAALLLDIDTFRHATSGDSGAHGERVRSALSRLGYRQQGNFILVEVGTPSPSLAGEAFGDFQAMVRELVVPVRIPPARHAEPFFKLIAKADLLDFPGVALKDSQNNQLNTLDLASIGERDPRLLTSVIKRGKTASIVMGYASELAIDAFALLIRSQTYPARPEQLRLGIEHWWRSIKPSFDPSSSVGGDPPLPLSLCLTFFGKFLNSAGQILSDKGFAPVFRDMLSPLAPLDRTRNTIFFATTYKDFLDGGAIQLGHDELQAAVDRIRRDPAFVEKFSHPHSARSLDRMVSDADGGVTHFLEVQSELIDASRRMECLQLLRSDKQAELDRLIRSSLPSGDDLAARQALIVNAVSRGILENLSQWSAQLPPHLAQFREIEDATSLMSYWIRTLTGVSGHDLEPIPLGYAQLNREAKEAYLDNCLLRWREAAIARLRSVKGFNWSCLGLKDEQEANLLLRFLSEGRDRSELREWILDEMGHVEELPKSSALREQLAVALGNFIRTGKVVGGSRQPPEPPQPRMLRYVRWENDQSSHEESPHHVAVIAPFLAMLGELRPPRTKRPPQPGDAELAAIWNI